MKTKKTTISYEDFQKKLEVLDLKVDDFINIIDVTKEVVYLYWAKNKCPISNYVEPILDVLIELKEKYLKSGGNFSFLKELNEEKKLKEEELKEELEKAKKILFMIKENKAFETKIAKIKNQLIFKRSKNEKKYVG